MLKTKEQIKKWLDKHRITNYTINDDLSVNVGESVDLYNKNLIEIPIRFNKVNGNFYCSNNKLTSLEGAPKEVHGWFYCSNNKLTSLVDAPKETNGNFYCDGNKLTSLKGSPEKVKGDFCCDSNQLTSLEYLPKISGDLYCDEYLHDTREYKVWQIGKQLREMV